MTRKKKPAWEVFNDGTYYGMWCVRQVGQRTFGEGFHLVSRDEAFSLCDYLNAALRAKAQGDEGSEKRP